MRFKQKRALVALRPAPEKKEATQLIINHLNATTIYGEVSLAKHSDRS